MILKSLVFQPVQKYPSWFFDQTNLVDAKLLPTQPTYQLGFSGLSDQKNKKGAFVRVEKLSFWESPFKIRDVAGTPTKDVTFLKLWLSSKSANFDFVWIPILVDSKGPK